MKKISLPKPHISQQKVISEASRFNAVCCGRRWGKTALGINRAIHYILSGKYVAWCSPTYKMLTEIWREASRLLQPISKIHQQQRRIDAQTGGIIEMWSLDNADALRGRRYHLVIIDEAAAVRNLEYIWQAVIRPTLTDYEGCAWFLSTPKGRDFFWECFSLGQSEEHSLWASWRMPTSTNPVIKPSEIELAKAELPRATFEQEYLAEFISRADAVFSERDINRAEIGAKGTVLPLDNYSGYLITVDIGRRQDATVVNVFDMGQVPYQRVYHEYLEQVPYPYIQQRIEEISTAYQGTLLIESNGVGDPVIENLRVKASPFLTTGRTKADAIMSLQILLEQERIKAKWSIQERKELLQYRWDDNGLQQDCVMSLAIAAYVLHSPIQQEKVFTTERVSISSW